MDAGLWSFDAVHGRGLPMQVARAVIEVAATAAGQPVKVELTDGDDRQTFKLWTVDTYHGLVRGSGFRRAKDWAASGEAVVISRNGRDFRTAQAEEQESTLGVALGAIVQLRSGFLFGDERNQAKLVFGLNF